MLGKDVAKNLRESKLAWTRHYYCFNDRYCVIGLKMHEAGIPDDFWDQEEKNQSGISFIVRMRSTIPDFDPIKLQVLQSLNDRAQSKEELINRLEHYNYAEMDFPLEALAELLGGKLEPVSA